MTKNLLALLIIILTISSTIQDDVKPYSNTGSVTLDANILNLGYSPNQKNLVVLINQA
jgi:hypothetical protein